MQSPNAYPRAVLFDLLTALLDSWTVWNTAAGSEEKGRTWRAEYLRLTYGCGAYVPYEQLVKDAARNTGLADSAPDVLEAQWDTLPVWSGARELLLALKPHCRLAVVTARRAYLTQVQQLHVARAALAEQFHLPRHAVRPRRRPRLQCGGCVSR